jgi:hypothetical protein
MEHRSNEQETTKPPHQLVSHVEKHKHEEQKPNSLLDAVYEDWKRENK